MKVLIPTNVVAILSIFAGHAISRTVPAAAPFECNDSTAVQAGEKVIDRLIEQAKQSPPKLRQRNGDAGKPILCAGHELCVKLSSQDFSCIDVASGVFHDSTGTRGNFLKGEFTNSAGQVATILPFGRDGGGARRSRRLADVATETVMSITTSYSAASTSYSSMKPTLTVEMDTPVSNGLELDTGPAPAPIPIEGISSLSLAPVSTGLSGSPVANPAVQSSIGASGSDGGVKKSEIATTTPSRAVSTANSTAESTAAESTGGGLTVEPSAAFALLAFAVVVMAF